MGFLDEITNLSSADVEGKTPPPTRIIDWLHGRVSTTKPTDIHHALGKGPSNASQGDHDHNGKNSMPLWSAAEIPNDLGASPTNAQIRDTLNQLLVAIRKKAV